eukprot:UN26704
MSFLFSFEIVWGVVGGSTFSFSSSFLELFVVSFNVPFFFWSEFGSSDVIFFGSLDVSGVISAPFVSSASDSFLFFSGLSGCNDFSFSGLFRL